MTLIMRNSKSFGSYSRTKVLCQEMHDNFVFLCGCNRYPILKELLNGKKIVSGNFKGTVTESSLI